MPEIKVISSESSPAIPRMVKGRGTMHALVWPGMGARMRSLHLTQLKSNSATRKLRHDSEAVYYVIRGDVVAADLDTGESHEVQEGGFIFIEPMTTYSLRCSRGSSEIVGGPCPPDPNLYEGMSWG